METMEVLVMVVVTGVKLLKVTVEATAQPKSCGMADDDGESRSFLASGSGSSPFPPTPADATMARAARAEILGAIMLYVEIDMRQRSE